MKDGAAFAVTLNEELDYFGQTVNIASRVQEMADAAEVWITEAVWRFPGRRGKLAGTHRGRAGVMEFLMKVPVLTGGTFRLELEDILANDSNAVAIFRGSAQRGGKTLDNPTALCMKMREGRVTEVWEFVWDLNHVEDFWA